MESLECSENDELIQENSCHREDPELGMHLVCWPHVYVKWVTLDKKAQFNFLEGQKMRCIVALAECQMVLMLEAKISVLCKIVKF